MPEPTPTRPGTFENVNNLLRAILWPLIVVILLICYGSEVGDIVKLIPEKLSQSSKISVGSLTLEIEKTARITGNPELGKIIKNLSENGIKKLLTLGSDRHTLMVRRNENDPKAGGKEYGLPLDYDVYIELENDGLLKPSSPLNEFRDFLMGLKPEIKTVYVSDTDYGSTWYSPDKDHHKPVTDISVKADNLSADQLNRIDSFDVTLSEDGRKAFDIIVQVIGNQIKPQTSCDTLAKTALK